MTAVLSVGCQCGRSLRVTCPALADMPSAMDAIEAQGWRWYPDVGHCCSDGCALISASRLALVQRRGSAWPLTIASNALHRDRGFGYDTPLFAEARA